MKMAIHLIVFALGVAAGVYFSVSHPQAAADIADQEQKQALKLKAAVSEARVDLLQKFLNETPTTQGSGYQRMLDDEKKKLADAKQALGNQ
jgi:hypothetical protein